jgi:hypothetical protein
METSRYWIALFNDGGESTGVQRELARCDQVQEAWTRYRELAAEYPDRIVMLCDRATVLARTDRRAPARAA